MTQIEETIARENEERVKQFREMSTWLLGAVAEAPLNWEGIKAAAGLSRGVGTAVAGAARRVGAQAFAREWKWARLAIPLQVRHLSAWPTFLANAILARGVHVRFSGRPQA